jgi:hypothetical protein
VSTLFRVAFALMAAITCCIAGWALLHTLGVQQHPRVATPIEVRAPSVAPLPPQPPLAPVARPVEASATRVHAVGALTVQPAGEPAVPVVVQLRSAWSDAPVASRPLAAAADSVPLTFAGVPHGDYFFYLLPESPTHKHSYLVRQQVTVPATPGTIALDVSVHTLRVRVLDGDGQPMPRAMLRLARADDPAWLPPQPPTAPPVTDAQGRCTFTPLGAGAYQVGVVDSAAAADVRLPAKDEVVLRLPRR